MSKENLIIREASLEDLGAILDMYAGDEHGVKREAFHADKIDDSYIVAFKNIMDDKHNALFVGELDDKVIATYQLTSRAHLNRQGSKRAQIESMYVDQTLTGQGIGTLMMTHAINEAKKLDCNIVQLTAHQDRKEAHRFYERLGFVNSHFGMKLYLKEGIE